MVNDSKGTFYKNELHCFQKGPYIHNSRRKFLPSREKEKENVLRVP